MVRQVGRTTKATDRIANTLQEKFKLSEIFFVSLVIALKFVDNA